MDEGAILSLADIHIRNAKNADRVISNFNTIWEVTPPVTKVDIHLFYAKLLPSSQEMFSDLSTNSYYLNVGLLLKGASSEIRVILGYAHGSYLYAKVRSGVCVDRAMVQATLTACTSGICPPGVIQSTLDQLKRDKYAPFCAHSHIFLCQQPLEKPQKPPSRFSLLNPHRICCSERDPSRRRRRRRSQKFTDDDPEGDWTHDDSESDSSHDEDAPKGDPKRHKKRRKKTKKHDDAPKGDSTHDAPQGDSTHDAPKGDATHDAPKGDATHDAPKGDSTHDAKGGDPERRKKRLKKTQKTKDGAPRNPRITVSRQDMSVSVTVESQRAKRKPPPPTVVAIPVDIPRENPSETPQLVEVLRGVGPETILTSLDPATAATLEELVLERWRARKNRQVRTTPEQDPADFTHRIPPACLAPVITASAKYDWGELISVQEIVSDRLASLTRDIATKIQELQDQETLFQNQEPVAFGMGIGEEQRASRRHVHFEKEHKRRSERLSRLQTMAEAPIRDLRVQNINILLGIIPEDIGVIRMRADVTKMWPAAMGLPTDGIEYVFVAVIGDQGTFPRKLVTGDTVDHLIKGCVNDNPGRREDMKQILLAKNMLACSLWSRAFESSITDATGARPATYLNYIYSNQAMRECLSRTELNQVQKDTRKNINAERTVITDSLLKAIVQEGNKDVIADLLVRLKENEAQIRNLYSEAKGSPPPEFKVVYIPPGLVCKHNADEQKAGPKHFGNCRMRSFDPVCADVPLCCRWVGKESEILGRQGHFCPNILCLTLRSMCDVWRPPFEGDSIPILQEWEALNG